MIWKNLQAIYRERGLVLAVGAGVSVGSGIPSWPDLLRRVSEKIQGHVTTFDTLLRYHFGLPAIATLLQEGYPSRGEFVNAVRDSLYQDFPFYPGGYPKRDVQRMVEFVKETNHTLQAVAAICALKRKGGQGYDPNVRIKAVVTFNLDALFQAYVLARFRSRLVRTIERPSASWNPGKIPVYHVHGFLRFDSKVGNPKKEAPDAMVLTEQDYFDVFNNPTSIFTYTFLHLLREHSFLFIGLSMNDDNLRRLLHYSKSERARSYLAEGSPLRAKRDVIRHFAVMAKPRNPEAREVIQSSLDGLGVRVLWVHRFSEIPKRLQEVYESGGDKWEEVF